MEKKLTKEQALELMDNITCDENGNTNKKCPLCGNDIIAIFTGRSSEVKCKTPNCVSISCRGI